jgi:hypothetical protein
MDVVECLDGLEIQNDLTSCDQVETLNADIHLFEKDMTFFLPLGVEGDR